MAQVTLEFSLELFLRRYDTTCDGEFMHQVGEALILIYDDTSCYADIL